MMTSLLLAHLHPDDIKGLILYAPPTTDQERLDDIARRHYLDYAELAERKGMEAVAETSGDMYYWPELCKRNCAGLTEADFAQIRTPTLVGYPLKDDLHPRESAEALLELLPNSEFGDYSAYYSPEVIEGFENAGLTIPHKTSLAAPMWQAFIKRLEHG